MSGHGTNLVFFDKKNKDWMFKTLAISYPPKCEKISFLPNYSLTQSGRHMWSPQIVIFHSKIELEWKRRDDPKTATKFTKKKKKKLLV